MPERLSSKSITAAVRSARNRLLVQSAVSEKELAKLDAHVAELLRKRIKPSMSKAQVRKAIDETYNRVFAQRARIIVNAIEASAASGSKAAIAGAAVIAEKPVVKLSRQVITSIIDNSAIANARPTLSATIWRRDKATRQAITQVINDAIEAGESIQRAADRLVAAAKPRVHLPRYVTEIRDIANSKLAEAELKRELGQHLKTIEKLARNGTTKDLALRASGQGLAERANRLTGEQLERQINRWATQKAKYNARRLLQNEQARAFSDAYVKQLEDTGTALKWNLSSKHPRPDVCDMHANANIHGLGPGIYPNGSQPMCPAHPGCRCFLTMVRKPQRDGRPQTQAQFLRALPKEQQDQMLGPGRAKWLRTAKTEDANAALMNGAYNGQFNPLWQLRGDPRPKIQLGEVHGVALPKNFVRGRESLVKRKK